jgi:predicted DNA-binding transcriptional regulator YafY
MYHPTTRVLAVLELLQSRGRLSGAELAARLEVDRRTVRRYITMLQDLGIPVEAERGRYGSYRLRPGFKLPPLLFTEDEALALTLGLLAVRQLGLVGLEGGEEGALAKLDRVLPEALRERVRAVQGSLSLSLPVSGRPETAPAGATVLTLSAAAQQGRRVWLTYRSWREEETARELDPYGLVYRAGRWYVVGWCHLRGGVRIFRLDRVQQIELRPQMFTPPVAFDSVDYVLRSLASARYDWSAEVLLEAPLELARLRVPPVVATLEEAPGGVVLRAGTDSLDWLARFLVSLDLPFVVRRPPELRDALRRLASRVAELAGAG